MLFHATFAVAALLLLPGTTAVPAPTPSYTPELTAPTGIDASQFRRIGRAEGAPKPSSHVGGAPKPSARPESVQRSSIGSHPPQNSQGTSRHSVSNGGGKSPGGIKTHSSGTATGENPITSTGDGTASKSTDKPSAKGCMKYGITGATTEKADGVHTVSVPCNKDLPSSATAIPDPSGTPSWVNSASSSGGECLAPRTSTSTACWDRLHLAGFVTWWWAVNGDKCKRNNADFAACFIGYATPYGANGKGCSLINTVSSCQSPDLGDFEGKWLGPTHYYVAWTIFNMSEFFRNYWQAISDANTKVADDLDSIVNVIDPVTEHDLEAQDLLAMLAMGLAFLPLGAPAEAGVEQTMFLALATFAGQTPGFARLMSPTTAGTTLAQQQSEIRQISHLLGKVVNVLQKSVEDSANQVMQDKDHFIGLANDGSFTGAQSDESAIVDALDGSLRVYTASLAMAGKGGFVGRSKGIDVHAAQHNGTKYNWDIGCDKYDDSNICGQFWYDAEGKTTYSLNGHWYDQKHWGSMMSTLAHQYHVSMDGLLAGAATCAAQGGKPDTRQVGKPTIKDGKLTAPCFSSLRVCDWQTQVDPNQSLVPQLFTNCPFNVVDPPEQGEQGDRTQCPSSSLNAADAVPIPGGYFGGLLTAKDIKLQQGCAVNPSKENDPPKPKPGHW